MNILIKGHWYWVFVVLLVTLFAMDVRANAQESSITPVATPTSIVQSLGIDVTPNDFSFESCNGNFSFDECVSTTCADFTFDGFLLDGNCIGVLCGDLSLDECMREVCQDFSFDPEIECPVENKCADANATATLCETEVCATSTVITCFDFTFDQFCDFTFDDFTFDDFTFDGCFESACDSYTSGKQSLIEGSECPFQDCINKGLNPYQCEYVACENGQNYAFCTDNTIFQACADTDFSPVQCHYEACKDGQNHQLCIDVPLAVQTGEVTAVSSTPLILMMMFTLLSTMSFISHRE